MLIITHGCALYFCKNLCKIAAYMCASFACQQGYLRIILLFKIWLKYSCKHQHAFGFIPVGIIPSWIFPEKGLNRWKLHGKKAVPIFRNIEDRTWLKDLLITYQKWEPINMGEGMGWGGASKHSILLFRKGIGSIYIILSYCESLILCISRLHLFGFYGALEGFAQFYSLFNFIIDFFNPKECCIPFLCSSRNYSIC